MSQYPECEKLKQVASESAKISMFLDWLNENDMIIVSNFEPGSMTADPIYNDRYESLLAEYFGIDLVKVEQERIKILESLR